MSLELGVKRFQLRSQTGEIVGGWFFNFSFKLLEVGAKVSDRGSDDASSLPLIRNSACISFRHDQLIDNRTKWLCPHTHGTNKLQ